MGIHLLASTQQPGAKSLSEAVANSPVRLLGRVASATLIYSAAGRARSQANVLLGRGDFLFLTHVQSQRFQAPLMKSELLDRLRKTDQVSRRTRAVLDGGTGKGEQLWRLRTRSRIHRLWLYAGDENHVASVSAALEPVVSTGGLDQQDALRQR